MYYIKMPILKRTPVSVILDGIEQAKTARAPREMINNLEAELVEQGVLDLLRNQNQKQN